MNFFEFKLKHSLRSEIKNNTIKIVSDNGLEAGSIQRDSTGKVNLVLNKNNFSQIFGESPKAIISQMNSVAFDAIKEIQRD